MKDGELAKLLGVPFGLNLDTKEVDAFLIEKLQKKLRHWNILHLPLVGRAIVINSVSASTLWFFIRVWGGTKKVIKKCKTLLNFFLWAGNGHHAKTRVNWGDCCAHKNIGGLGLTNLEGAL